MARRWMRCVCRADTWWMCRRIRRCSTNYRLIGSGDNFVAHWRDSRGMTISTHRVSRRRFLGGTAAVAAVLAERRARAGAPASAVPDEGTQYVLHFAQPAATWPDALPVGNGRLGAMVFGAPSLDRLQLNEESIWDGERRDRNNPHAGAA